MTNAEIELNHIKLELERRNGRPQHLRHFIDCFFCYENGYVNKSGTADWNNLIWREYVSVHAAKLSDRKDVVKEHVVPIRLITKELVDLKPATNTAIKATLNRLTIFATITKREDSVLRSLGLSSKMPVEYYQENHPLYNDPFARYKVAGIEIRRNENELDSIK